MEQLLQSLLSEHGEKAVGFVVATLAIMIVRWVWNKVSNLWKEPEPSNAIARMVLERIKNKGKFRLCHNTNDTMTDGVLFCTHGSKFLPPLKEKWRIHIVSRSDLYNINDLSPQEKNWVFKQLDKIHAELTAKKEWAMEEDRKKAVLARLTDSK